ncbi:1-acyl-sn-glycerol-3-phosphate acyltransferase [Seinonella peptonophila]|uniref:1-acyl-sn-glycerol-3-phosphate acyltransferase n=1 Tax=Seinonella peptonophila TaxID=112248 RepID=A0A1M4THE5_9BACL|nr:lysophospholipid acyltransferase family protein [Seinonella peptonophila]SHE43825.1 1-acyl-sn-glycerol-3-phosphate acyltransferase [Seinonella peptonophila]
MLYAPLRTLCQIFLKILFRYEIQGLEHIPNEGGVMICSNHISNLDPPMVGSACPRPIHFLAKAELFKNRFWNWFFRNIRAIPIKRGGADTRALREAMETLRSGKVFGIFPEGRRSQSGEIEQGHRGAAVIALKTKSVIIPTAVIGSYRPFRKVRVVFGEPILTAVNAPKKVSSEQIEQLTQQIMDRIHSLVNNG